MKIATAPSAVAPILSKVGASSVLAKAFKAISVSLAERPACDKILDVCNKEVELTPNPVASDVIVFVKSLSCETVFPVTWEIFTNSRSKAIDSLTAAPRLLVNKLTALVAIAKPVNLRIDIPRALPMLLAAVAALLD